MVNDYRSSQMKYFTRDVLQCKSSTNPIRFFSLGLYFLSIFYDIEGVDSFGSDRIETKRDEVNEPGSFLSLIGIQIVCQWSEQMIGKS